MKHICHILVCIALCITLMSACAKVTDIEHQKVAVTVVDVKYIPESTNWYWVGGVVAYNTTPAQYRTYVEYEGKTYKIRGEETYNKCKDIVGKTIIGNLTIYMFDDGTSTQAILSLVDDY